MAILPYVQNLNKNQRKILFMNVMYYFSASYRRKQLDKLQAKYSELYKGKVLDIGGRDRGRFKKPKEQVEQWVFADISPAHNPDIILDVANMQAINDETIDVISALELFEHVEKVEKGLQECFRILKPGGKMLISVPFMHPIHADPYDFQRWTNYKWTTELNKHGFIVTKVEIMGLFFTLLAEMNKSIVRAFPFGLRHLAYLSFPVFDILRKLDKTKLVKNHKKLGGFHGGYFIIAQKSNAISKD